MVDNIWKEHWRVGDGNPINGIRMAIIELDDFQKTKSDGGVVKYIEYWTFTVESKNERKLTQYKNPFEYDNKYKCVPHQTAEVGWILQSKTGVILDSNISNN
jgi:hypothetical protein